MAKPKPVVSLRDMPNLKRQRTKAINKGKTTFKCWLVCGVQAEFDVNYAEILIEYIELRYKKRPFNIYNGPHICEYLETIHKKEIPFTTPYWKNT